MTVYFLSFLVNFPGLNAFCKCVQHIHILQSDLEEAFVLINGVEAVELAIEMLSCQPHPQPVTVDAKGALYGGKWKSGRTMPNGVFPREQEANWKTSFQT